jgi:hypothetical protein
MGSTFTATSRASTITVNVKGDVDVLEHEAMVIASVSN